jgi:hypothetical protein
LGQSEADGWTALPHRGQLIIARSRLFHQNLTKVIASPHTQRAIASNWRPAATKR